MLLGNGVLGDRVLPLPLPFDHYEVLRHREWCTVMVIATGKIVFKGEERAEVVVPGRFKLIAQLDNFLQSYAVSR